MLVIKSGRVNKNHRILGEIVAFKYTNRLFCIRIRIRSKIMKKLIYILLLSMIGGLVLVSCKSQEKCAAYGEAKNFKIEQRK